MKRTAFKRKATWKRLAPMSERRKSEAREYKKRRALFLQAHPICTIRKLCNGARSRVVCHLKGRGIYFLDESTWGAGCWICEWWLTNHATQAIAEGLAMDRIGKTKDK